MHHAPSLDFSSVPGGCGLRLDAKHDHRKILHLFADNLIERKKERAAKAAASLASTDRLANRGKSEGAADPKMATSNPNSWSIPAA